MVEKEIGTGTGTGTLWLEEKKKLEMPEIVTADANEFSDEGNWLSHRRSFEDFETYYSKVFFSSNMIYICQYIVRYLPVKA